MNQKMPDLNFLILACLLLTGSVAGAASYNVLFSSAWGQGISLLAREHVYLSLGSPTPADLWPHRLGRETFVILAACSGAVCALLFQQLVARARFWDEFVRAGLTLAISSILCFEIFSAGLQTLRYLRNPHMFPVSFLDAELPAYLVHGLWGALGGIAFDLYLILPLGWAAALMIYSFRVQQFPPLFRAAYMLGEPRRAPWGTMALIALAFLSLCNFTARISRSESAAEQLRGAAAIVLLDNEGLYPA